MRGRVWRIASPIDGERFHTLATRGLPPALAEAFGQPWTAGPGSYHQRLIEGEPLVHTDGGVDDPARRAHPQSRGIMEIGGARTVLLIALHKDEKLLGSLFFYRQEVRPFSDKQVDPLTELRGAGRDRDGKYPADHRDARSIGATDRHRRSFGRHQLVARRPGPRYSTRCSKGQRGCAKPQPARSGPPMSEATAPR